MSLVKKIFFIALFLFVGFNVTAEEVKKVGKFKDWETMVLVKDTGVVCFAQSKPLSLIHI